MPKVRYLWADKNMKIITSISPKGGAGKTTLLYCLAKSLHDSGLNVLVLDPDSNQSFYRAYGRRMDFLEDAHGAPLDFPTVNTFIPSKRLERQISDLGEGYDVVVVDTYGKIESYHKELMFIADLVLVPTQPNQSAINNALDTCNFIEEVREENDGLPIYGVALLNFAKNGVEEREYRKNFNGAHIFGVETRPYGKAYKLADRRGLSVTELDKIGLLSKQDEQSCTNAAIDMRRLCKEIIDVVTEL